MNEPYQRVHKQEDSNSTLGTIAKHIGFNVAASGAFEGATILGAKKINKTKHPVASDVFNSMAYNYDPEDGKYMKYVKAGAATKQGRILNYGGSVIGGLLTGAIASSSQD